MESVDHLIRAEGLPAHFETQVLPHYRRLADYLDAHRQRLGRCSLVAINGAQGTGKSTLALFLQALLAQKQLNVAVLSIDDLYFTAVQRQVLAQRIHPLLATRGAPGTHDVDLGLQLIRDLQSTDLTQVSIPRFDKARDDRASPSEWHTVTTPVDLIILEGWCVGAKPLTAHELMDAPNALERDEDPQGLWRTYQNQQLAGAYQTFFDQFDQLIMLRAPDFAAIKAWRALQERKLAAKVEATSAPKEGLMDGRALERFMLHYERLTERMLEEMPQRADVLMELDSQHVITHTRYSE